jgi:hypothetical protein
MTPEPVEVDGIVIGHVVITGCAEDKTTLLLTFKCDWVGFFKLLAKRGDAGAEFA